MADRNGLFFVGLVYVGITVAVMTMAAGVVFAHIDGSLVLAADDAIQLATLR